MQLAADRPTADPYTVLAPFYDRILGHFRRPFEALRDRILADFFPASVPANRPRVYCDLACGTGTACLQMAWRGWHAHGVDNAPGMLAAAHEKLATVRKSPPAILSWLAAADHRRLRALTSARAQRCLRQPLQAHFHAADMRSFRLPEPADLITCLFDSINHLPRHRDLTPTLRQIRANLAPGGLALIDVNSTRAIREIWPAMKPEIHQDDDAGYLAILQGGPYESEHKRASITWTWFLRDPATGESSRPAPWRRVDERYYEIAWTRSELTRAVRQAGLKLRFLKDAGQLDRGFDPGWRHVILMAAPHPPPTR